MNDKVTQEIKKQAETVFTTGEELLKSKRLRILAAILVVMTLVLAIVSVVDTLVFDNPLTLSTFSPIIVLILAVIVFQVLKQKKSGRP